MKTDEIDALIKGLMPAINDHINNLLQPIVDRISAAEKPISHAAGLKRNRDDALITEILDGFVVRLAEARALFASLDARVARLEGRSAYDLGVLDQKAKSRCADFDDEKERLSRRYGGHKTDRARDQTAVGGDPVSDREADDATVKAPPPDDMSLIESINAVFGKDSE
ncbi:hypothetical protein [Methylocella sp.]|uniref:hypothetical protein n=1 Tax=Methylocella sp. TaxID=1978226 RepID=UPI0037848859